MIQSLFSMGIIVCFIACLTLKHFSLERNWTYKVDRVGYLSIRVLPKLSSEQNSLQLETLH